MALDGAGRKRRSSGLESEWKKRIATADEVQRDLSRLSLCPVAVPEECDRVPGEAMDCGPHVVVITDLEHEVAQMEQEMNVPVAFSLATLMQLHVPEKLLRSEESSRALVLYKPNPWLSFRKSEVSRNPQETMDVDG